MKKTLILSSGKKYKVVDENDKYYICEGTQFRKNNSAIVDIEIKKTKEPKEEKIEEVKEEEIEGE